MELPVDILRCYTAEGPAEADCSHSRTAGTEVDRLNILGAEEVPEVYVFKSVKPSLSEMTKSNERGLGR